jgi:hypothetical protein
MRRRCGTKYLCDRQEAYERRQVNMQDWSTIHRALIYLSAAHRRRLLTSHSGGSEGSAFCDELRIPHFVRDDKM